MMAQVYSSPILTLVDAINARIDTKNAELDDALADHQAGVIAETSAYLGVLNGMVAELSTVHRVFHRSAIGLYASHGLARLGSPRTYLQLEEQQAERLAYGWLEWLTA